MFFSCWWGWWSCRSTRIGRSLDVREPALRVDGLAMLPLSHGVKAVRASQSVFGTAGSWQPDSFSPYCATHGPLLGECWIYIHTYIQFSLLQMIRIKIGRSQLTQPQLRPIT